MQSIEQEVNKIRNELTDIGCKLLFGKTSGELVQWILADIEERADKRQGTSEKPTEHSDMELQGEVPASNDTFTS